MITRNKAKLINALRIPKYRKKYGLFVAEGTKLILELLQSDFGIDEIYATSDWIKQHREAFRHVDHLVIRVEQKDIDAVSSLSTPPNVMAIINIPEREIKPVLFSDAPTIMLDGINDPGNLGSIIRSADWFGIPQIVCSENTVDAYHPKVVQASMGSIFRLRIYEADLMKVLSSKAEDIPAYGAFMDGKNIHHTHLNPNGIYIIGSESHGISPELTKLINHRIAIPRYSRDDKSFETESLNAAVAAAIILAEMRRTEQ
jgi:RNA methyltransferase, TrmH family